MKTFNADKTRPYALPMAHAFGFALAAAAAATAEAAADGTFATYQLRFEATWSESTHPTDFPSNPHFSGLIGGTHNSQVDFWTPGGLASTGMEDMAERGRKAALMAEVEDAIGQGTAWSVVSDRGISPSPGVRTITFEVSSTHPHATIVSMVAPSPDWFIGTTSQPLRDGGDWEEQIALDLNVYDAGTDSGTTFTSPNANTDPQEPIAVLDGFPFLNAPPVGSYTFTLLSVAPPTAGDMNGDQLVDFDDIPGFVLGLTDSQQYAAHYGLPATIRGDIDSDGDMDFDDIHGFVDLLFTGARDAQALQTPEPATMGLALVGMVGLLLILPRRTGRSSVSAGYSTTDYSTTNREGPVRCGQRRATLSKRYGSPSGLPASV